MEQEFSSRRLPSTHWSEIASANHTRQQKGREALDCLLTRYQAALLAQTDAVPVSRVPARFRQ